MLKIKKITKSKINKKNCFKLYKFLINNINDTTFKIFGYSFFLESLKINFKNSYYIEKNKKIISYISYIDEINEKKIKRILISHLIKNPFKYVYTLIKNIKFFFKLHSHPKNFIQLMHLIIKLETKGNSIVKKKLNRMIESLHKKKINQSYKGIYAMYGNENFIAAKYYKKNMYKIYNKNYFYTFVKKKLNKFND